MEILATGMAPANAVTLFAYSIVKVSKATRRRWKLQCVKAKMGDRSRLSAMPWKKTITLVVVIGGGVYVSLWASYMAEVTHLEVLKELFG